MHFQCFLKPKKTTASRPFLIIVLRLLIGQSIDINDQQPRVSFLPCEELCVDKLEEKIHLWPSFYFRKFIFGSFQADLFGPCVCVCVCGGGGGGGWGMGGGERSHPLPAFAPVLAPHSISVFRSLSQ